jgi:hypothetical protein
MTSQGTSQNEKRLCDPATDAAKGINRATPAASTILNREVDACEQPPPEGGLTGWLVVLSCFLMNFNLLGVNYAYGQCLHSHTNHFYANTR